MRTRNIQKIIAVTTALLLGCTASIYAQTPYDENQENLRMKLSSLIAEGAVEDLSELVSEVAEFEGPAITFWEEIQACGFYPQESRLECVIEIKQRFGYGGPVGAFGSFEYVKLCVDWNNNGIFGVHPVFGSIESVGQGNVHMHDETANSPPWHYAVYRDIDLPGGPRTSLDGPTSTTITSAPTLRARAILSWFFEPKDCNYTPIWGNVFDFRIRIDPIR